MTNQEAKFLLQGYRPGGADTDNEAFAEALAHAPKDPALRKWFESEQSFDGVVAGKLRELAPPAGLRESILAGTKLTSGSALAASPVWWMRPWFLSLTAAAAVVMAFVIAQPGSSAQVARLPGMDPVLRLAMDFHEGAHEGEGVDALELGEFGAWLMNDSTLLKSRVMPADLAVLKQQGCRVIDLAGHEVFEVCIKRESGSYHVFIAPRAAFEDRALDREPMFHLSGDFIAATWSDRKFAYLVSGSTDLATMQSLL